MASTRSIALRALLAVALMVGFYILAISFAILLLGLPFAEIVILHRIVAPTLLLACIIGGISILVSIVPRWDSFPDPGPRLEAARHPRLFAAIDEIARATDQAPPDEVFLVGDVNAFVTQRGGIMGFFSRRVMGVGLPLLQVLSVSELRAVLAHEFGHFHGGDTRLGPWVYKTRAAIGRTIGGLRKGWLRKPFILYGSLFLRITHAVSRRQELDSDALASRVVGSRPLIEGLKKVQVAGPAYQAYWEQEVSPVLGMGFLPPIADGFRMFSSEKSVTAQMQSLLEKGLEAETNPYDTHPPLPERIKAASAFPAGPDPAGEPAAISLLDDVRMLERSWLAGINGDEKVRMLDAIAWSAVPDKALLPRWRETVERFSLALDRATVGDVPDLLAQAAERLARATSDGAPKIGKPDDFMPWLCGAAMALALARAGWRIDSMPGSPVVAWHDGAEVRPFDLVHALTEGKLTAESWRAEVDGHHVGALAMAP